MTFNLTEERLNRGHSVVALADVTGVRRNTIARLEAGKGVRPADAKKVADYFGVKVTDLMPVEQAA